MAFTPVPQPCGISFLGIHYIARVFKFVWSLQLKNRGNARIALAISLSTRRACANAAEFKRRIARARKRTRSWLL